MNAAEVADDRSQLLQLNQLTMRRRDALYFPGTAQATLGAKAAKQRAIALKVLGRLGYRLSPTADQAVSSVEDAWLVVQAAALARGANVTHEPFYTNFPRQVEQASDEELRGNALLHYLGDALGARIMPDFIPQRREKLGPSHHVELGLLDADDLRSLAADLLGQSQPYSQQDQQDLICLAAFLPATAPQITVKENLAFLAAAFPSFDVAASFATATDVLRYAVALSGGDVTLATSTKFVSFSRPQRRALLELLDRVGRPEDLHRWLERWKRLARHLRVGDYADRYPNAARLLHQATNATLPRTFTSHLEAALANKDLDTVLDKLIERPGEFARRLNHLLRLSDANPRQQAAVVSAFAQVADQVATGVLIQLWGYFTSPDREQLPQRVVATTSRSSKTIVIDSGRIARPVDPELIGIIEDAISSRGTITKAWLDRELFSQFAVPLGIRSASSGLRTAGRGSRLRIPASQKIMRLFIHWRDLPPTIDDPRVDVDLSAYCVSADFARTEQVAYYNLRTPGLTHSGDITSAPNGAAEFIDVSLAEARAQGWRYVVLTVHSYSQQPLVAIPECWAGVMPREHAATGEVFEPSTVTQRLNLTSPHRSATPFVFDLETLEMIWWDHTVPVNLSTGEANLANTAQTNMAHLKHLVTTRPMMLDRLIELLADELVADPHDADVVFADPHIKHGPDVIGPWHTERILSLLAPPS